MASPPSRSASASLSTPLKLPPTGPRALRGANDVPQPGPSGLSYRDKISFAIPLQPSGLQSRKVGFDSSSSLGNFGSKVRSITVPKIPVDARSSNGFSSSSPAESSRQAQTAQSQRHGLSNGRESQTSPSFPSSSSSTPYDHQTSSKEGTSRHSTTRHHDSNHRRSPSPRSDRDKSPLNGAERPSRKVKDAEEDDYRARFLPTDSAVRSPISIALPGFPNGTPRPRPPHLDVSPFEIGVASKSHHPPIPKRSQPPSTPRHRPPIPLSPDEHYSVPPPPADRPPTPPPPTDRSPTPPPPPDLAPLPPPSPPVDPPSLPTPPMISRPRSPSPPPATTAQSRPLPVPRTPLVTTPFSLPTSGPSAPPSFHFRELPLLPLLRKSPSADEESVAASEGSLDPPGPELPLDSPPPAAQASSRPRSTSPPPYIPPPYVPPASTRRRSGIGNFLVLHDPAAQGSKGGKEVIKRYDGKMGEDEVKVEDPRLQISEEVRQRGRGSAKQRTGFHELEYEWDEYSTGPKPPPPPTAVLITGLNPLTTVDQISKFLRPHGRIREIEPKMDLRSGMQLGICWVKFDGPLPGRPGTGQDVANQIIKVCDGQRIGLAGDERIKIVLDGRGLRTEEAVKEERARRHPPKKVELPKPIAAPAIKTPSSGAATPRPDSVSKGPLSVAPKPVTSFLPRPNRPQIVFNTAERSNSSLSRSLPVRSFNVHSSLPSRPMTGIQQLSSSFIDAPFAHRAHDNHRKHYDDFRESHFSRHSRSRSRSYSLCSTCTPDSESDDDRPVYRRRSRSPYGGARGRVRGPGPNRKEDEDAVERMKKALAVNGHAYAFIDANSLPPKSVSEEHLKDHFRAFKPSQVRCNYQGWCILFNDDSSAQRAKFLDSTSVQGHRLVINVKTPSTAQKSFEGEALPVSANEAKVEKGWRFLTFTKKNRPTIPPPKASSKTEARPRRRSFSSTSSEDESSRLRSRKTSVSSASELSEEEAKITVPKRKRLKETPTSVDDASITIPHDEPMHLAEGEPEIDVVPSKKRAAKPKTKKGAKKARITSDDEEIEVPIPLTLQPEVVEIKLEAPKKGAKAVKEPKPKKVAPDPVDKLVASGEVADEEDAYWLGQALEAAHEGFEPDFFDDEEELLDEKHPLHHVAGAWRAEGLKKVPQIQKSSYLPQRNRAAVSAEDAGALTSGRTARVTGRRLALDMETHRKTAASVTAESDLFAFNQLRIRKKQLRFARSAIEGYGLYAMETIQTGEMVCEYVGEICRSAVAEIREQRYLKQGIGSSYLFRIDADAVCDATFRGSVSRLINHSCDPSASAKIISINGHSKIVIYAKRTLHPGEEILYDYKFPLESDPALRVPCLCGAATCRGWLN